MWTALALAVSQAPTDLTADFEVPEGLAVTLWAETPQLYNPSAMDVDARGWVWVTEAVNYRRWNGRNPGFAREGGDRVVVMRDTDLDGRCDESRVFVQDPELVAPLGILVDVRWAKQSLDELRLKGSEIVGERVFVSCSPSILVYEDKNGDGDAIDPGEKDVFLTGFGGHDHDHGVHSLVWGPDGRLYFATGNAGPHIVTDKSGWTLRSGSVYRDGGATIADNKPGLVSDDGKVYTGGLILSVNADGTDLRVEAHNFRNPYEVTLDSDDELYIFDNDDEVTTCRASWVLRGGNYGFFSADGSRTWRADQRPGQSIPVAQWHMEDPGVATSGTFTGSGGPTGICFYDPDGHMGDWFDRQLLCADAGRGEVFAFKPVPEGAGIRLEPRPSVIRVRTERTNESARWFRPSDIAVSRDGAIFLADWYDPGVGGHGMGDERCYGRILRVAPKGYRTPDVSRWGQVDVSFRRFDEGRDRRAELSGLRRRSPETDAAGFMRLAREYDGRDRNYLEAYGLACEGREEEVFALLSKELGGPPAQWDARFAGLAWRLHPPSAVPGFAARAMEAALPLEARKQALDALAFVKTKEAADAMANLAVSAPEDLRPHARWWLENRATNEWSAWVDRTALGGGLEKAELAWKSGVVRTGSYELDVDVRDATKLWLVVSEGEQGNSYDWADWLAPRFEGGGKTTKLVELDWLSAETGWGTTHEGKNCDGGPLVVEGKTFTDGIGTHARSVLAYAVPAGAERFRATAAPDDMGSKRAGSTNELEFQVWLERPPSRGRIERLLNRALHPKAPGDALEAWRDLALDPEGGLRLVSMAERGELQGLPKKVVSDFIFRNPDLGVRARASALFPREGERPRPSVEALLALRGDPARGRELFLDPRAQCATCHGFEHGGRRKGGDIGPELTGVRTKFDAARIFDAILNPSAEIAHGFETWRFELREGELVAGFLLADGPTVIVKDTQGQRHALESSEIRERTRETLSVMPDGVASGLTDQELADVVAFLRADPQRAPEFGPEVELFDGKSLEGWSFHLSDPKLALADVWSVRDGTIVCRGNPAGYIQTLQSFTSFELTLEWRFDPAKGPGNSGVLMRKTGPDQVWPRSIEAQLQHTNAGDIWNIGEFPMAVDAARSDGRHTTRRAPCSEKPLGEWNRYKIRLDRGLLTLEVNDVVQNTASWCQEVAGPICLQSEGAEIHFRNVRLRPILN